MRAINSERRELIVRVFSEWTAFCAAREAPMPRTGQYLYPLIRTPHYARILRGDQEIIRKEFDEWHEANTQAICIASEKIVSVGWAAKLINIYLKTHAYLTRQGRPGLTDCLHPAIDGQLMKRIKMDYRSDRQIMDKIRPFRTIHGISDYSAYASIIDGCRLVAEKLGCSLIEVEALWKP